MDDVRVGYGRVEVLHGVSLDIPTGGITALIGPNGAGKTSLLAAVAGLLPLRSGTVRWDDTDLAPFEPHERAAAGMVLVPQGRGVFPDLTVRDNLEIFAGSRTGWDPAYDAFPILPQRLEQPAGLLSGGEQQMLAMARALVRQPRLLLLDELSAGLAPRITRQLFEVVADLARHGTTIVLVEQHVDDALRLADLVYVLSRGDIAFAGDASELAAGTIPGYVSRTG
jgi:branched-chain amino acid transport system ATP-binding protein